MKYLTRYKPRRVTYKSASNIPTDFHKHSKYDDVKIYDLKDSFDIQRKIYFLLSRSFDPRNVLMVFYKNLYLNENGECVKKSTSILGKGEITNEVTTSGGLEGRLYLLEHKLSNYSKDDGTRNYNPKFLVAGYRRGKAVSFNVIHQPC